MKKWKRVCKILMCLTIVLSLVSGYLPMYVSADTLTGVQYVYDNENPKKRIGIESVIVDGTTYYDIFGGSKEDRVAQNRELEFLQAVVNSKIEGDSSVLEYWSDLAYAVFADRSYYSSIINASGGFQKNFGSENARKAGYADLAAALAGESYESGSKKNDYTYTTGLSYTNKLSNVRSKMASSIASGINRKISGDRILNETDDDNTLKALNDEDDTDVLYSIVTAIDRSGKTFKYTYNSYGLAFYDFQLSVIADDGLEYITAAEGYNSLELAKAANAPGVEYDSNGKNNSVISYYENRSREDADISMEFKQSSSVSMSNTLEETKTYSFSEMIGSATEIKGSIPLLGEVKETLTVEFTAEQVLSTAYSETKSQTKTTENTVSSKMTLPGQTAVAMETSDSQTSVTLNYDCPIAITFKVAMFSLSGNVYDDSAAVQKFSTAGYRQAFFSTIFGSDSPTGGKTATENLYNRAIAYTDVNNYEQTYGQTEGMHEKQEDGKGASRTYELNWDNILGGTIQEESVQPETATIHINCIAVDVKDGEAEIVETGEPFFTTTNEGYLDYDSYVNALETIQDLEQYDYTIYEGEVKGTGFSEEGEEISVNLNGDLTAVDNVYRKAVTPIYQDGEKDDNGNELKNEVNFYYTRTEKTEGASSGNRKSVMNITPASDNSNSTIALKSGTNDVQNKVIWLATNVPMSVTGGTITTNAKSMNSNIYDIQPIYPLDYVKITSNQKTFDMMSGDVLNLDTIVVDGYNKNDVHYYGFDQAKGHWVLVDAEGKEVTSSKIATIQEDANTGMDTLTAGEEAGTIYVKYVIDEDCYGYMGYTTDYAENSGLSSTAMVKINVSKKPFYGTVTAEGDMKVRLGEEANLSTSKTLKAYVLDETDKKISNASIIWESQLDENDGIKLENNMITISEPGKYKVRATYGGKYSDWATITGVELSEFVITDEKDTLKTRILGDTDDNILQLDELVRDGKDQYGDEWDFTKDTIVWKIDGQEIAGSELDVNTLTAGTHKVQAVDRFNLSSYNCDIPSNELTFELKEARRLSELTIETSLKEDSLAVGESYDLNNVVIKAKDQYGDEYTIKDTDFKTWTTSGRYAVIDSNQTSVGGLVVGKDELILEIDGVKSNAVSFEVYTKPYAKELYITSAPNILEGVEYNVTDITEFTARDQYGASYTLSQEEKESLVWTLTDQGTIPAEKVIFDSQTKKILLAEGTVNDGETGSVILRAVLTNQNGSESVACYVTVNVRQKAALAQVVLKKKDSAPVIRSSENAWLDEMFTYEVLDQYGKELDTSNMTFTWESDNEEAYAVDNVNGIITAGASDETANITLVAKDSAGREITSNKVALTVPRVRTLEGIEVKKAPDAIGCNSTFALNELDVICLDDYKVAFTEDELKAYPASVAYTFDPGTTDARFDTAKNVITTGAKYGYVTITAMAVNSSSDTFVNENGKDIMKKVSIWVGPYVTSVEESVDVMEYYGGTSEVTLTGQYLVNNMTVGLFDSNGKLTDSKKTSGDDKEQKAKFTLPVNESTAADVVYTVKYSLDGSTYYQAPTGKITVNKKRSVSGMMLDKVSVVLRPGKETALAVTVNPSNTTDAITWNSSDPAVATVDSNGNVKAVDSGKAVITVTAESGVSASCNVVVGLAKGDKFNSGRYTYKVTNDRVDGQGTMTVTGFVKGKATKNAKIAAAVKYNGISYKVTAIGNKAFYKNSKIKTLNTGKNVKTIGIGAFRDCKNIKTVVIGDAAVTIKNYAFYNCKRMTNLTIGKNVTTLGKHSFCQNTKLKKITIKSSKLKTLGKPHVFINVKGATVSVPAKKLKRYKKLLTSRGLKKSTFKKLK